MAGYVETANNAAVSTLAEYRFISLHTADPGETGLAAVQGSTRQETTWGTAAGGAIIGTQTDVAVPAGNTISYWGAWNAETGGDFLGGFPLLDADDNWLTKTFTADGTFSFTPTLAAENVVALPGPKGAKGDTGPQGPAGTVSVGTVTTGNAGSDAAVSNSGTNQAAKLDFSIPKGDKGDAGPQGPVGRDGLTLTGLAWDANKHLIGTLSDNSQVDLGIDPAASATVANGGISDLAAKAVSWDAGGGAHVFARYDVSGTPTIAPNAYTYVKMAPTFTTPEVTTTDNITFNLAPGKWLVTMACSVSGSACPAGKYLGNFSATQNQGMYFSGYNADANKGAFVMTPCTKVVSSTADNPASVKLGFDPPSGTPNAQLVGGTAIEFTLIGQ